MLDLDNFKQINDLNGHKVGDLVLAKVAQRVRALLPSQALIARIGGDEFICAIPHPARASERMEQIAEQIIAAVSAPIEHKGGVIEPTISIGMVSTEQDGAGDVPQADGLIHRADIAMYHAKKNGRNRFFWFEAQMEDEIRLRHELESGIRRGIKAGEFVPYYEQQIDLETGKLVGFEMLARWNSPKHGLVKPEVFIPIAEEIDLIAELSETLIEQALQDAKAWDPRLTLSINISPLQLQDPWFAQRLLQMMVDAGFPPNRLEIEITENCLHQNIGAVRSIVTSLKNQGVRISLDDFGTGFSSLSQLRTLPFDRIKIDRSFVADLGEDEASNELVEAIISLGRGMSLPITAEGIENTRALDALKAMGDLKGQGYLYGRPEDANATRNRLAGLDLLTGERAAEIALEASEELDERKAG
jgi:diguanylate cyclase (GGDEF)-like protein